MAKLVEESSRIQWVAIYTRVSTDSQCDRAQLEELSSLCSRSGWSVFEIYREVVSGTKGPSERRELSRMLHDARERRFAKVVVWSADRMARSVGHLICVLNELRASQVEIFSLQQGIDTGSPMGSAMWQILGVFAEFEQNIRRERQVLGIQRAKAKGVKFGRRPASWVTKEKIIKLRRRGLAMNKIAKELGVGSGLVFRTLNEMRSD